MTRLALMVGILNSFAIVWLWWSAMLNDWTTKVNFNSIGEGWLEGVLMHGALALIIFGYVASVVDRRRKG